MIHLLYIGITIFFMNKEPSLHYFDLNGLCLSGIIFVPPTWNICKQNIHKLNYKKTFVYKMQIRKTESNLYLNMSIIFVLNILQILLVC